ncbi:hypothetical protein BDZ91DRAFT_786463 [Kalaharituber pfeilii]|nr:hypothetical protein BDZ91DRAFT_786463 [Kalaharituber pfeilii]
MSHDLWLPLSHMSCCCQTSDLLPKRNPDCYSQLLDMPLTACRLQSPPPDIPSSPNILSKPIHHRSQHSKSKSNSAAEVLAVVWAASGVREMRKMHAHMKCIYATQAIYGPNQSTPTDRLTTNILEVKGGGSTTSGKGGKRQARGQGSGKRGRTRAAKDTDNKIVVKSTALFGATDSQPPLPPPSTLEEIIQQMQQLQQLVSGLANRAIDIDLLIDNMQKVEEGGVSPADVPRNAISRSTVVSRYKTKGIARMVLPVSEYCISEYGRILKVARTYEDTYIADNPLVKFQN